MIINDRISKMKDNYNEDRAYFFSCREMFRWLYQKGILKEISFLFSEKENSIYFAFDTDDLLKSGTAQLRVAGSLATKGIKQIRVFIPVLSV